MSATLNPMPVESPTSGAARVPDQHAILCEDVSKFYGDVLGVNRVNLRIGPGITSLVGPNGAGKTTLMNLMTGLVHPTRGRVRVCGVSPSDASRFFRLVGYCTQYDSFPKGVTGRTFIHNWLRLHGYTRAEAASLTEEALERAGMTYAADRQVAGYSKGMRQRIRLAQAISHHPRVLVLDEPLNGLDPMARGETLALFQELGAAGMHVVVSSHILHEVDRISDRIILITSGYVVAEGNIQGVRDEVKEQPMQVLVRCGDPRALAARFLLEPHIVEARLQPKLSGVLLRTTQPDTFYRTLQNWIVNEGLDVEMVAPADDDAESVYHYLIGSEEEVK
jgi:ABC-2 type transport system ATP-binding protein